MESRDLDEARFEESRTLGNLTYLIVGLLPLLVVGLLIGALFGCFR